MSADIYTTATELAILQAGRTPVWETQSDTGSTLPPAAADDGVYLEAATRALVHVALREDAHHRTARLRVTTVDLTCIYTVTINGTAVTYNATTAPAADLEDIIEGIAAAIMASGTLNVLVLATAENELAPAGKDTVLIKGLEEADFSLDFTQDSSAVVTAQADLCGAELRLWWAMAARPGNTPPTIWAWSGELYNIDRRGRVVRLDVAGLDRLFVQLSNRIGQYGDGSVVTFTTPVISIGPALTEVV